MHYLLPQLRTIDAEHPVGRKLLLVPSVNYGRELLASLARVQGSWVGWEVATLANIAGKLATVELTRRGRRLASDIAVADTVSAAFDVAVRERRVMPALAALSWSAGTQRALADAILELRVAGVTPAALRGVGVGDNGVSVGAVVSGVERASGGSVAGIGVSVGDNGVSVAESLAVVLERFESLLETRAMADAAEMFDAALAAFEAEARFVLDHAVIVAAPNWRVRGVPARLWERLAGAGMRVLALPPGFATADGGLERRATSDPQPIHELGVVTDSRVTLSIGKASGDATQRPSITMFGAASPADELRSVIRQALSAGAKFEDVEIVCTDRDTYGASLDALCAQMGIRCTMVDGLPLSASRVGRVVERWLRWIESGYQSAILREGIEAGDFASAEGVPGAALAAELRRIRIGWGLAATRRAVQTLRSGRWRTRLSERAAQSGQAVSDPSPTVSDPESVDSDPSAAVSDPESVDSDPSPTVSDPVADDAVAHERTAHPHDHHRLAAADALAALLDALLALAPDPALPLSTSALAERTATVLAKVTLASDADESTRRRVLERLDEVAAVASVPVSLTSAIAALRQELVDTRAWTSTSETTRPRRATGGHLHLTSLENAGTTGRPFQCIVGLDSERAGGPTLQSPLLPDALRARLNERRASLPTTDDRRAERARQLALALNGSTAALTLSYAVASSGDGRATGPASLLLDVARARSDNSHLSYRDLATALGPPRSPIPDANTAALGQPETPADARDVWLAAMSDGALLLDATPVLREAFPGLRRGLHARDTRAGQTVGAFHGLVEAAGALDPRQTGAAVSPSSLERIARCGLHWFYANALGARVIEEPVYDPMVWLNALDRGSALHTIYERLMQRGVHAEPVSAARDEQVRQIVDAVAAETERQIPAPSASVLARETAVLHDEARLFIAAEHDEYRATPFHVVALESQFGDAEAPATFTLDNGDVIRVHGRVDRVDRLRDGTLRLVDYKTGSAFELDPAKGAFQGGRKLQLALYSPAISAQFAAPVSRAEYRFTTARGDGMVARADETMLNDAPRIVRSLLDDVARGRFLPTMDAADCAFCEYAAVCRVTRDRWAATSPRASWAKRVGEQSEHFAGMRARRGNNGEGDE